MTNTLFCTQMSQLICFKYFLVIKNENVTLYKSRQPLRNAAYLDTSKKYV